MSKLTTKSEMRREIIRRLKLMSSHEKVRQSNDIQNQILSHSIFQQSQRVAIYLPMAIEVDTTLILQTLLDPHSGKQCFVPLINPDTEEMQMMPIFNQDDLLKFQPNKWNIFEPPKDGREDACTTGGLDLVLCPGLAFDLHFRRLGRGKGYYDRFFHTMEKLQLPTPVKMGIAFSEQIVEEVPTTANDINLNGLFYPHNL
jgi:5-formyltetrahydrofolate cyclo-ligase